MQISVRQLPDKGNRARYRVPKWAKFVFAKPIPARKSETDMVTKTRCVAVKFFEPSDSLREKSLDRISPIPDSHIGSSPTSTFESG